MELAVHQAQSAIAALVVVRTELADAQHALELLVEEAGVRLPTPSSMRRRPVRDGVVLPPTTPPVPPDTRYSAVVPSEIAGHLLADE